jgi:Pyridoxamine 5'-phosphate oxidase
MAKFYAELTEELCDFISRQHLFFTATAAAEGRINLSPKGMDSFRCLDKRTVAYLDVTGSGNETAAHLGADGRITVMFCSFDAQPVILRLYGHGRVIRPRVAEWSSMAQHFPTLSGTRQIMVISVESVHTSCGYGIPLYQYQGERGTLLRWAEKKGPQGLADYWQEKNQTSIDGLPTRLLKD